MSSTRRYVASAVIGSALLASAGCGPFGSSKATPTSSAAPSTTTVAATVPTGAANKALVKGAAKVTSAGSAKISGSIVTTTTGSSGAKVTVRFTGAERWSPTQAGKVSLTGVEVGGVTVGSATLLVTAKALYIELPQLASVLHKRWAEISLTGSSAFGGVDLGQFAGQAQQLQPGPYLSLLSSSVNVKSLGTATIGGVSTTHYSGTIDLQKALASLPQAPPVWTKLATSAGIRDVHINAWIDAAGRPRKVTLGLASSALTLTVTLDLSDYGVNVVVTPPPASETLNLSKGLLGALG